MLGTPCAHCGLAVAEAPPHGDEPLYCCSGCATAAAILRAGGLEQYYRLGDRRHLAVQPSGRQFEEFDHEAFEELYVERRPDGHAVVELYLEGVHCASCVWLVERIPVLDTGIVRAELDMRRALVRVEWQPGTIALSRIAQLLDRLGYAPHPFHGVARDVMRRREDRAALVRIGVAGALAGNVMLVALALYAGDFTGMASDHLRFFRWVSLGLTLPALLGPGRVFFAGAWAALRTGTLHMDLPIALALAAGATRGAMNTVNDSGPIYFDGVTTLIFLLLVGRYLQQRGQRVAADAAELLLALTPRSARVRHEDGTEEDVPSGALLPGMTVLVRPGELFPADGAVERGRSTVNRALLTGESEPVAVGPGEVVVAGTENLSGELVMRVESAGSASRLARLLRQVEEGVRRRAPVVALANRISGVFVAVVVALASVTLLLWWTRDPVAAWDHAIALLIVTCPCALALATPLAVSMAVGRAARVGIFIKGSDALEQLARPGVLVLDKTGTITAGGHELVAWRGDEQWRALILGLEAGSLHPVADGFRRAWADVVPTPVEDARHDPGGGITATWQRHRLVLGSPRYVAVQASGTESWDPAPGSTPLTRVLLAVDGVVVAAAGFGDPVRPGARHAIAELRQRGWRTVLLSGDAPAVVAAVGHDLGFAPADVRGGASPEEKEALVAALRREHPGTPVVMVGDGVNDAAAFAAANVGVGVHGGAEASLLTADVHLTTPGIAPLLDLVDGAGRTMRLIRRNMAWALAYNAVGIALAMAGVLSPLVAAILMPASSLTVVSASWLGRSFHATHPVRGTTPRVAKAPLARAA